MPWLSIETEAGMHWRGPIGVISVFMHLWRLGFRRRREAQNSGVSSLPTLDRSQNRKNPRVQLPTAFRRGRPASRTLSEFDVARFFSLLPDDAKEIEVLVSAATPVPCARSSRCSTRGRCCWRSTRSDPGPRAVIPAGEPAVRASRQLGLFQEEGLGGIGRRLAGQYDTVEEWRRKLREGMVGILEQGLAAEPQDGLLRRLFEVFRRCPADIPVVVRALTEVLGSGGRNRRRLGGGGPACHRGQRSSATRVTRTATACSIRPEAVRLWKRVAERPERGVRPPRRRLRPPQKAASPALMYGKTPPSTRRLAEDGLQPPQQLPEHAGSRSRSSAARG